MNRASAIGFGLLLVFLGLLWPTMHIDPEAGCHEYKFKFRLPRTTVLHEARQIMREMLNKSLHSVPSYSTQPLDLVNYTLFRKPQQSSLSFSDCVLSDSYSDPSEHDGAQNKLVHSLMLAIGNKFHVVLAGGSLIHAIRYGTADPNELRLFLVPRKSLPGVLNDTEEADFMVEYTTLIETGIKSALWDGGFSWQDVSRQAWMVC